MLLNDNFYSTRKKILELKKDLPQLKVMLGGFREPGGDSSWVDILLVGRCANIFLDYLQGKDISQYKVYDNPPGYKNPHGVITDKPVTPAKSVVVPPSLFVALPVTFLVLSTRDPFL